MTSTQHTTILDLMSAIQENSIASLMDAARRQMDFHHSESNARRALEIARQAQGLLTESQKQMEELILTLEKSRDLS
jgi:hypothetical protein